MDYVTVEASCKADESCKHRTDPGRESERCGRGRLSPRTPPSCRNISLDGESKIVPNRARAFRRCIQKWPALVTSPYQISLPTPAPTQPPQSTPHALVC